MKNVYISRIYFILAYVSLQVKCETFTLDLAKDADASMWKIKGFQEYLEDGSNLRGQLAHFFPAKFPFANFDLAQGVWVIVPSIIDCPPAPEMDSSESIESNENTELVSKAFFKWLGGTLPDDRSKNETSSTTSSTTIPTTVSTTTTKAPTKRTTTEKPLCYGNSSATFQFNLRAQLLTSIKLKYSLGGNALIKVYTPGVEPFEIYGNRGHQPDNWIEEKVPLSGRSVTVEPVVIEKGGYVLIDKIIAESFEASTKAPSTRDPTTTESPKPSPASGQGKLKSSVLAMMIMLVTYVFM